MDILFKYFSDFTETQTDQFRALDTLYKDWNEKINVISRRDIDSLYEKHVLHSLAIAAVFDFAPGSEVVDIGTGGGFPGVPLAIFFPEVRFHLIDSIGKKLKVVDAVKEAIGLTNLITQHTRAEDIRNRKFDFAVSRAVAPLKELIKWSRPLIKNSSGKATVNGISVAGGLICLKGGDLSQEIHDSGVNPRIMEINSIFNEPFFEEKYILYTPITK